MSDSTILPGGQRVERDPHREQAAASRRSVAFSAARGAGADRLAVIIGIVLLQVIDDGTSGPIGDGGAAAAGGTTDTTAPGRTRREHHHDHHRGPPVKPPAEVAVLVLNGSGRPGAATAQSNTLKGEGYQTLTPADARGAPRATSSTSSPGFDRECTTVATSVDGPPKVEAMPSPPPSGSENASCVVILGA